MDEEAGSKETPKPKKRVGDSPRNRDREGRPQSPGAIRVPENPVKPKRGLPCLDRGYIIVSKDNTRQIRFGILDKLNDRAYTAVKGTAKDDSRPTYFIRLEPTDAEGALKQLKREVLVLHQAQTKNLMTHFYNMIARGRVPDQFNYLVTFYAPMNLDFKGGFSPSDVMRLAMLSLKSVRDLHELGFIHRNIKPTVFVLVTSRDVPNVVLTTMEYSRKFRNDKDNKSPKLLYRMKKTKYLPRCYHLGKEFGRRDDLESWFYTMIHLIDPNFPKWENTMSDAQMIAAKDQFMHNEMDGSEEYALVPREFGYLRAYINKLETSSRPDYGSMNQMMTDFVQKEGLVVTGALELDKQKFGKPKYWQKIAENNKNKKKHTSGDRQRGKKNSKDKGQNPNQDKNKDDIFVEDAVLDEPPPIKKGAKKGSKKGGKATSKQRENDDGGVSEENVFDAPAPPTPSQNQKENQYASLVGGKKKTVTKDKRKKRTRDVDEEEDEEGGQQPKPVPKQRARKPRNNNNNEEEGSNVKNKRTRARDEDESAPKNRRTRDRNADEDRSAPKNNRSKYEAPRDKRKATPAKTPAGMTAPTQNPSSYQEEDEEDDKFESAEPGTRNPPRKSPTHPLPPKGKSKSQMQVLGDNPADQNVFRQAPKQLPKKGDEEEDANNKDMVSININSKVPPPMVFNANKVPDLKDEDPKEEL